MKILLDKYPMGTYPGQKSDGKFMDGYLYSNLEILSKRIVDDMTFLGIIFSSTLEVGTGKSVLATQIGEAWTEIMKKQHNVDVPFTTNNIVFTPKDLIERAFKLPRYSCILLDEWEDQTYWSELGVSLRKFFRKCRQLNLFMLVIIPNWFQMNLSYAVSRSAFAIDVKFGKDFERGFFSFYNFNTKKELYIKGKKEHNYRVVRPTFNGRFLDGYGVDEVEYRKAKLADLKRAEEAEEKGKPNGPRREVEVKAELARRLYQNIPKITQKQLASYIGINERTLRTWLSGAFEAEKPKFEPDTAYRGESYDNPVKKGVVWDEALTSYEAERTLDNEE